MWWGGVGSGGWVSGGDGRSFPGQEKVVQMLAWRFQGTICCFFIFLDLCQCYFLLAGWQQGTCSGSLIPSRQDLYLIYPPKDVHTPTLCLQRMPSTIKWGLNRYICVGVEALGTGKRWCYCHRPSSTKHPKYHIFSVLTLSQNFLEKGTVVTWLHNN